MPGNFTQQICIKRIASYSTSLKITNFRDDELYISTGVALGSLEDAGVGGSYGSEDGQTQ